MTQNEHFLIAIILHSFTWHFFLKKYFITQEDIDYWQNIIEEFFYK